MFLRQDPHALSVLAEAASEDLQQYLAGVRYQRDAPVVALCPILLFMGYHDDGLFPLLLLRHLVPPPNTNDDGIEQSPAQGGITIESDLEQLNGGSVDPTAFPFANEWTMSVSSCIVG